MLGASRNAPVHGWLTAASSNTKEVFQYSVRDQILKPFSSSQDK